MYYDTKRKGNASLLCAFSILNIILLYNKCLLYFPHDHFLYKWTKNPHKKQKHRWTSPLLSAAPPFMIRATRIVPVCSSCLIVAPYEVITDRYKRLGDLHCIFTLLQAALL